MILRKGGYDGVVMGSFWGENGRAGEVERLGVLGECVGVVEVEEGVDGSWSEWKGGGKGGGRGRKVRG